LKETVICSTSIGLLDHFDIIDKKEETNWDRMADVDFII
jgi:hypothetical protein